MHDIRFLDEALDIHKTIAYHLSIQAGLDGFSFVIFDPTRNKFIALKYYGFAEEIAEYKYPDRLLDLLKKDEFLNKEYSSVHCIWNNSRTTLLPSALFEREKLKQYFEFNQILNDLDELHANHLKKLDAYLIFPIHHEIANIFIKQYPTVKFFNQSTPFIEYAMNQNTNSPGTVFINIQKKFFDILIIRNHSLILHNTFNFRFEQDMTYFIMNVYDKVVMDPALCPIYVSGIVEKNSALIGWIRKFIKTVNFSEPDNRYRYSHAFNKVPEHFFINLFNLYHCG
jgi:hypothetical protein